MSNDPWKHRSDNMKCKTCMWFVPKQSSTKLGYDLGRCRRHAPSMGGYPVVMVNDWCGDHRLDEDKAFRDEPKFSPSQYVEQMKKEQAVAACERCGDHSLNPESCIGSGTKTCPVCDRPQGRPFVKYDDTEYCNCKIQPLY